jgi:hypothetical protein
MYPYYKRVSTLNSGDVAAVQTLYAAGPAAASVAAPVPAASAPASLPAPTPTPSGTKDTTAPTLTITSPGGSTASTSAAALTFSGTASDNVAVAGVTWKTNTGSLGTASGTTKWTASIPLLDGSNTVTVTATDSSGNTSWRSVVVSRP